MATALKPYREFDGMRRPPVSFEVLATEADPQTLLLPIQPRTTPFPLVHQPSGHSRSMSFAPVQAQLSVSHRRQVPQAHLQPQLKVTSSAVLAAVPLEWPQPRRGMVKPLPKARLQPRWLRKLRVAQRCSTVLATGLVVTALVVYGTTVYTQHRWGSQYGELNQAEKERSLMDAFGESLKHDYAEQASQSGSPLSGQPTPQYKIPLEPQNLRPNIEIPPEDPMANQPQNFPKGY